jgi:hypothetical protein
MRGACRNIDLVRLQIVEGFEHQTKWFLHQLVSRPRYRFLVHISGYDGHGASNEHHLLIERSDFGREELVKGVHLVHDVADDTSKELLLRESEKFIIRRPYSHNFLPLHAVVCSE